MNDYYDMQLKEYGLEKLKKYHNFTFIKADISDISSNMKGVYNILEVCYYSYDKLGLIMLVFF